MKIINLGRGQGKTIRLLYASEWQDLPIVCATYSQKQHLIDAAKELGLNIPEPIVASEIATSKIIASKTVDKDLLIDEKIPSSQRDDLLLLEKDNEIINIFGVKKSTTLLQSKNNNILITLREKK